MINWLLTFLKCSSATTNPLLQTVFCIANHAKLVQNRQKRRGWELIFWWRHTKINVETRAPYSHDTSREPARVGISDTIMQASSSFYFTVSYITQLCFTLYCICNNNLVFYTLLRNIRQLNKYKHVIIVICRKHLRILRSPLENSQAKNRSKCNRGSLVNTKRNN